MIDTNQIQDGAPPLPAGFPTGTEPTPDATEATPRSAIEAKAIELGWNPDYAGDHAKTADEWVIERFEREAQSKQKWRAKAHQSAIDASRIQANAAAQAERDLRAQRRQAIQDNNPDAVEIIDEQLERVKQAKAQSQSTLDFAAADAWQARNPWFSHPQTDEEREKASDVAAWFTLYTQQNPGDIDGAVEHIEAKLRRHYADKSEPRSKAPRVEGGRSIAGGRPAAKGFADLPPAAKEAAVQFEKRGVMSRQEYAKSYFQGA